MIHISSTPGRLKIASYVLATALLLGAAAMAAAAPTAQEILDSVDVSGLLAGSGRALIELLVEKGKQAKVNRIEVYRYDDGKGTSRQMVEFLSPADVKGTKFLSIVEPGAEDQMWLYLPAVGRERRIAGSSAQGQFMGTDFTFEEISLNRSTWEQYTPSLLADRLVDGVLCHIVKLAPKSSGQSYSSLVLCVSKGDMNPVRIEFYGKGDKLQKVMTLSWDPQVIRLENVAACSTTTVKVLEYDEGAVPDEVFTLRYLRK